MAQTELRLRLIKDGKITHIVRIVPGKGVFRRGVNQKECDFVCCDLHFALATDCNSFELGIKVDDEWWFEGDKGELHPEVGYDLKHPDKFWLKYDGGKFYLDVIKEQYEGKPWLSIHLMHETVIDNLKESERIGNIHEE